MTVYGTIYDNQTNTYLPGATIQVTDQLGNSTGPGVAADGDGYFSLTSPVLDQGGKVLVSNVGYKSALVDPSVINSKGSFGLDESADLLSEAVVTAKKITKSNYAPWLIAGGAGLLLLSTSKKKKSRSIGAVDLSNYILPVGLVGIAAYAVYKFLGPSAAAKANNATDEANTKAANDAAYNASAAILPQSMPDVQLSSMATQIYNSASTGGTGDIDNVIYQLSLINNTTDLYRLMQLFGTKQVGSGFFSTCSLLGFDCTSLDLDAFIRASLTPAQLATVNQNFSGNGINYQF